MWAKPENRDVIQFYTQFEHACEQAQMCKILGRVAMMPGPNPRVPLSGYFP